MAHEHWPDDFQRVEYVKDVIGQPLVVIASRGKTGCAKSSTRNTVHMAGVCEPRRELIEDVCCGTAACQQDECPSGSTPIEHFQPDRRINGDEPDLVWRRITPRRLRRQRTNEPEPENPTEPNPWNHLEPLGTPGTFVYLLSPPGSVSLCCRSAAAPMSPPMPIDSTALLGISISAPFSLSPS